MNTVGEILQNYQNFNIGRLDLELLMAKILDCSRTRFYSHPESCLLKTALKDLNSLIRKRSRGVPIAYLINKKEFYGRDFFVDERVLIPRPETEMIIDEVIAGQSKSDQFKILDIGTGSGAIAVTLALEFKNASLIATDISRDALDVARINANRLNASNIEFILTDLLEGLTGDFDVITANLPYIGVAKNRHVERETLEFEPHIALFAGEDGLDLYRKCFKQLRAIKFKIFIGEFGFGQSQIIVEELERYFAGRYEIKRDLTGIPRIFIIKN